MLHILIADDHEIVRRGLQQIISEEEGMNVVAEAASAHEVREQLKKHRIDVLTLDLSMPGTTGVQLIDEIVALKKPPAIIVLSVHSEEHYGVRALKAGAAGFMNKEAAPQELVAAIRKVAEGGKYITPALAEKLAQTISRGAKSMPHEDLSDREFEVLRLLASGKTVTEIAGHLHLSPKSISTYRTRILNKMNLKTNAELTHYAFKYGIVQ